MCYLGKLVQNEGSCQLFLYPASREKDDGESDQESESDAVSLEVDLDGLSIQQR